MSDRQYRVGDRVSVRRAKHQGRRDPNATIMGEVIYANKHFFTVEVDKHRYREAFLWVDLNNFTIEVKLKMPKVVSLHG